MKPIDLLTSFLKYVRPPQGTAIELIEADRHGEFESNWESHVPAVPPDVLVRYESAAKELKRQHPRLDWSGETEHRNGKRRIARWLSEVDGSHTRQD